MPAVLVLGARGGSGTSVVATNLSLGLAHSASCLLMDLNPCLGYDDLLLDVPAERSWLDLLPVAAEVNARHLEGTATVHGSGLKLLAAPERGLKAAEVGYLTILFRSLAAKAEWLVADVSAGNWALARLLLPMSDRLLLVVTPDAHALRAARRLLVSMPERAVQVGTLVLNQLQPQHPAHPQAVAESLGIPLLGVLPVDSQTIGYQVSLGQPCLYDRRSPLGKALLRLVYRLLALPAVSEQGPVASSPGGEWEQQE